LNAPGNVKAYFKNMPKENMERVTITDEILMLANNYIVEKVVGQTSFEDCNPRLSIFYPFGESKF